MKRACIETLEAMALDAFGPEASVIDFACDWVSSGKTLLDLSEEITTRAGRPVSRGMVSTVLNGWDETSKARLEAARSDGAYGLADKALRIVDGADKTSKAGVTKARVQADTRLKVAEAWNRPAFGRQGGTNVNVAIALPNVHGVVTLSQPAGEGGGVARARLAGEPAQPQLEAGTSEPSAIAPAIAEDAEVLSVEDTTS